MALSAKKVKVGLLHTTVFAVQDMVDELARQWPEAEPVHFLDEGFLVMLGQHGGLSKQIAQKTLMAAWNAEAAGVDCILCSCSSLSPAIRASAPYLSVPICDIDSAMAESVISEAKKVVLLTTADSVHRSMVVTFEDAAKRLGKSPELITIVADVGGVKRGDNKFPLALAEAVGRASKEADAVVVGQVSMAGCIPYVDFGIKDRVYTGPAFAVASLKRTMQQND